MNTCRLCGAITAREICSDCFARIFHEEVAQLEKMRKRIDELETALGWYLCEDHKEVEMGVLEGVWKRPAHKALIGRFEVNP